MKGRLKAPGNVSTGNEMLALQVLSLGEASPFVPLSLRASELLRPTEDASTMTEVMLFGDPLPRDTRTVSLPVLPATSWLGVTVPIPVGGKFGLTKAGSRST